MIPVTAGPLSSILAGSSALSWVPAHRLPLKWYTLVPLNAQTSVGDSALPPCRPVPVSRQVRPLKYQAPSAFVPNMSAPNTQTSFLPATDAPPTWAPNALATDHALPL